MPVLPNANLLIVGNFSPGAGYAWDTIGEHFLAIGQMYIGWGSRVIICYPEVDYVPHEFSSAGIEVVGFDFSTESLSDLYRLIKKYQIRTLYLTDRSVYSFKYLVCRLAGIRNIIVHDRTSGDRDEPRFFKKWAKKIINHYPIISADIALAVSDFVKKRLIRTSCFPESRTVRIWNGVDVQKFKPEPDDYVFSQYNIPRDKKIVFAYSRANKYKGIQVLIESAAILIHEDRRDDLFFLYCGDGPDLEYFQSFVAEKKLDDYFLCPGRTKAIAKILKGVTIVVVPSIWQEGLGLSVKEGMATGKVVIASNVGGIVELITDSEDGYLIPPSDSRALAAKIALLSDNEDLLKKMGDSARQTIINRFSIENTKRELCRVFKDIEERYSRFDRIGPHNTHL
jgi:glycosyltransferase involved in cell wall biosynthesis